jgi:putative Holliday junction resolvase
MTSLQRYLGIDYGSKRIGIAISDPLNIIARTLKTLLNTDTVVNEIKCIVDEYSIGYIVVGMPLNLKGERGKKAVEVEQFIVQIEKQVQCTFIRWDERFTTKRVQQTLRELNVKKKQRESKAKIDEMAAAHILQSYLDSRKR